MKSTPQLTIGTLARFGAGIGWPDILALTPPKGSTWWRCAVVDAENRGLLEWDRTTRVWRLTPMGREQTKDVA